MTTQTERFADCWRDDGPRVLAFARRHVGPDEAPDVVSDVFTIAWTRWDDVSDPPIAWLLVTARHVIHNRLRSGRRRRALADRVAHLDAAATTAEDAALTAVERREALDHLARLDEQQREALLLVSWDGLSGRDAAAVLGIAPAAFRRRLSRARASLDRLSGSPPPARRATSALPVLTTPKDLS